MLGKTFRFGKYVREVSIRENQVSYRDLAPKIQKDASGKPIPYKPPKINVAPRDAVRILNPYVTPRFMEQFRAVFPLAVYLILFQLIILREKVQDSLIITGGLISVIIGLMLFMEGLKLGLMPLGETIGSTLPTKSPLPVVLFITFILGIGVTFAEPAIGALQAAGSIVDPKKAPYLYTLLNEWSGSLVLMVGIGVGFAAVLGTLRFIYNWSLKPLIYISLVPTLVLTAYVQLDPELRKMIGLAWDCGAVTTGPVTVPIVLALGIGVASAVGKGDSSLSGFGIVTLASLFPIIAVLGLAIYLSKVVGLTPELILAKVSEASAVTKGPPAWYEITPGVEVVNSIRAIVPLVLFLFFVMKVVLREKIRNAGLITYGIVLAVVGMMIFNLGLTYGLAKLGDQSGGLVPGAFTEVSGFPASPLYNVVVGLFIASIFAWFLGFGATLAEPALNALGMTVENLTNGAFKKSLLMYSVSFGVATGISLGILKIVFDWQLAYLLIPGYIVLALITAASTEEFVNVGWDSAGVTTGPVTVPLVMAMGLGFAKSLGALEGFGILSLASICPIISVLICGLYIQWNQKRKTALQVGTMQEQSGG